MNHIGLSAILVRAQSGDRDARSQLATLTTTELKPLILRASRRVAEADRDDVQQDTFLLLINPRVPFNPDHPCANAYSYCFNAARSAVDARGRARARRRYSESEPTDLVARTDVTAEIRHDLGVARRVDKTMFSIVSAFVIDGATAKDAGADYGLTPSAVCRSIQRYVSQCRAVTARAA